MFSNIFLEALIVSVESVLSNKSSSHQKSSKLFVSKIFSMVSSISFSFFCSDITSFTLSNLLFKSIKSVSIISCFSSILSAVSTVGSTYGNIDFLCSGFGKSIISITSSKGSSIFGSNIVFSFINRFVCSFSISLSFLFPKWHVLIK